jgi:hypothetical protein
VGRHPSGGLAIDGADLRALFKTLPPQERTVEREAPMMARFCRYIEKVFDFSEQIKELREARKWPRIVAKAVWGNVFFLFVMRQKSLNAMEQEVRKSKRMERLIGKIKPRADRLGDGLGFIEAERLREMLPRMNHQVGRNKALQSDWRLRVAATDGHEFFSPRHRCCPQFRPQFLNCRLVFLLILTLFQTHQLPYQLYPGQYLFRFP